MTAAVGRRPTPAASHHWRLRCGAPSPPAPPQTWWFLAGKDPPCCRSLPRSGRRLISISSSPEVIPPGPHLRQLLTRRAPTKASPPLEPPEKWPHCRTSFSASPPQEWSYQDPSPSTPPQKWLRCKTSSSAAPSQKWSHLDPISIDSSPGVVPPGPHLHWFLPRHHPTGTPSPLSPPVRRRHGGMAAVCPLAGGGTGPSRRAPGEQPRGAGVGPGAGAAGRGAALPPPQRPPAPRRAPPRHLSPSPDVTGATRGKYSPGERNCPRVG